jgi:dihydroorotase-like cyclic amidohydrolase
MPVLPGLVDTHVHINEPGRTEWEGFTTATRAAAAGGVTTLVDMPLNSVPATTSVDGLRAKIDSREVLGGRGILGGVVPGNTSQMEPLLQAGVLGFKCHDQAERHRRSAQESGGAIGLGEMKSHVACDGPEMRAVYSLAAEMKVPVLIHFADFPQFEGEGTWNSGIARFPAVVKAKPENCLYRAWRRLLGQHQRRGSRRRVLSHGQNQTGRRLGPDVERALQLPRWPRRGTSFEAAADRRQMRRTRDAHGLEADDVAQPVPPDHLAERNEADQDQQLVIGLRTSGLYR